MQIEYAQGDVPQVRSHLAAQLCHRLAAGATLLLAAAIYLSASGRESSSLNWVTVFATDAAVLFTCIALVIAHRSGQRLRELLVVLFFSLLLAHLAVWELITPSVVTTVRQWAGWTS